MKVAFFLGGFNNNGGIGRVVSILVNELVKKTNFQIYILTLGEWNPEKFIYEVPQGIHGTGWNEKRSMKNILLRGGITRLREYLIENEIDVLLACGALYYPISVLASKAIKTKCICWEHSNANNKADHKFQMLSRWIGAKFADAVLVLTKQDYGIYKKKYHTHKIYQIYNPMDPKAKKDTEYSKNSKKIISVGRLTYQKNYPALVQVAKSVLEKNPEWKWDIYGEGPERKELENLIESAGLRGRLELKGQVTNLYERYSEYAFLVMTSRYEGFSMVLLEALANNLPMVAFDVECGPREIIDDGYNGYLIQPFKLEIMVNRINALCKSEKVRMEMSFKAEEKRQEFSIDEILEQWQEMLCEVNRK